MTICGSVREMAAIPTTANISHISKWVMQWVRVRARVVSVRVMVRG